MERAIWALHRGKASATTVAAIELDRLSAGRGGGRPVRRQLADQRVDVDGNADRRIRVTVTQNLANRRYAADCASANERCVVAVGWVPTDAGGDTRTKAHQRITAVLMDLQINPLDMPCALCVRGDIQVGGTSTISAREDTSCGNRYGTWSTQVLDGSGTSSRRATPPSRAGPANIYGSDGNSTANQATDMAVRRARRVRRQRHDRGPAQRAQGDGQGQGHLLPGRGHLQLVEPDAGRDHLRRHGERQQHHRRRRRRPTSARSSINGNPGTGPNNSFKGWIIVNGGISISGNVQISGMVYAVNDISYSGTGTGFISGQMISQNVRDTVATVVDTNTIGNSSITYNCSDSRTGGGVLSPNFLLRPGSSRKWPTREPERLAGLVAAGVLAASVAGCQGPPPAPPPAAGPTLASPGCRRAERRGLREGGRAVPAGARRGPGQPAAALRPGRGRLAPEPQGRGHPRVQVGAGARAEGLHRVPGGPDLADQGRRPQPRSAVGHARRGEQQQRPRTGEPRGPDGHAGGRHPAQRRMLVLYGLPNSRPRKSATRSGPTRTGASASPASAPGRTCSTDAVSGPRNWRVRVELQPNQAATLDLTPTNHIKVKDDFPSATSG